jgi:hypothetical protein
MLTVFLEPNEITLSGFHCIGEGVSSLNIHRSSEAQKNKTKCSKAQHQTEPNLTSLSNSTPKWGYKFLAGAFT